MLSHIWLSEQLPKCIKQSLIAPLKEHSKLFTNEDVLPTQRFNMIFGRRGVGKCTALKYILDENQIDYVVMDAEDMDQQIDTSNFTRNSILIIENADSMIVGPYATSETRTFAINLKRMAQSMGIFVYCLVNAVPSVMTQGDRDLLGKQFLENFDATIYFAAPNVDARGQIFKKFFAELFDHLEDAVSDELTEDDYNLMVDSSAFATPLQMREFTQRVALLAVQHQGVTPIDEDFIKSCLFNLGPGAYSIVKGINGDIENRYAQAAGFIIPSGRAKREYEVQKEREAEMPIFGVEDEPEKREREEEEEEEEGSPKKRKKELTI